MGEDIDVKPLCSRYADIKRVLSMIEEKLFAPMPEGATSTPMGPCAAIAFANKQVDEILSRLDRVNAELSKL